MSTDNYNYRSPTIVITNKMEEQNEQKRKMGNRT
jgi:hypothetical protein